MSCKSCNKSKTKMSCQSCNKLKTDGTFCDCVYKKKHNVCSKCNTKPCSCIKKACPPKVKVCKAEIKKTYASSFKIEQKPKEEKCICKCSCKKCGKKKGCKVECPKSNLVFRKTSNCTASWKDVNCKAHEQPKKICKHKKCCNCGSKKCCGNDSKCGCSHKIC